jgi:hypothetical protein
MGERRQWQVAAETEWMNFVGTFDESSLTSAGRSTTPLLDQTGVTFHIERTINGDIKDTFYLKDSDVSTEGKSSDQKLLKGSMLGRPIPPTAERQDVIKVLKTYFRLIHGRYIWRSHRRLTFINISRALGVGPHDARLKTVTLRVKSQMFSMASSRKTGGFVGLASDACICFSEQERKSPCDGSSVLA